MDPRQQLTLDRATVWCQEKKSLVVVTIIVSEARALCRSSYSRRFIYIPRGSRPISNLQLITIRVPRGNRQKAN